MSKKISNYDHFLVKGGSMLPTIKPNQKIKILKTKDVKIGDIIVFKGNTNLKKKKNKNLKVIHRVVRINGNKIITKGDHRCFCDLPITSKEILGKVIKVGNKRIDTSYYNFINPFIAKMSYFSMKFNFKFKIVPVYIQDLKKKIIGDRDLHIESTILSVLHLPHKINQRIFWLLKR